MAKLAVVTTLILVLAIGCAISGPTKQPKSWFNLIFRLWSPCDRISFSQKTGETYTVFHQQLQHNCNKLTDSMQTVVTLLTKKQKNCAYKLIGYSGYDCQDSKVVNVTLLSQQSSVVKLNERRSICSYKLGNQIQPRYSITVTFRGGSIPILSHEISRADTNCYNLCSSRSDKNFPNWVEVHDDAGNVVKDNYIQLFSKLYCAEGSEIKRSDGSTALVVSENLDHLTQFHPDKVVGSYLIVRLK